MTNQILTPGYLRWDGTKYVLDPISPADRTGPPGPAGSPGGQGPEGPEGPAGSGTEANPLSAVVFVDGSFPADTITSSSVSINSVSEGQTSITNDGTIFRNFVGKKITISGAATPANNGEFVILSVNPTSYYNPNAVAPDINNNAILSTVSSGTGIIEGNQANIIAGAPGLATLTGLSGMIPDFVGKRLVITGAGNSGNNGAFLIVNYNSPTSVDIYNQVASTPDANNESIVWTFRDGSISKPFQTLQQAINSIQYYNLSQVLIANIVLVPGNYDGFSLLAGNGANIIISAIGTTYGSIEGSNFTPGNPAGALITSDIILDGGEGQIFLSLKDIYTNQFSYTPTQVRMNGALRELFLDKSFVRLDSAAGGADLVTMYDDESFLFNTVSAVPVRYKSYMYKAIAQLSNIAGSIHNPHLYLLTGTYSVSVILEITAAATTGTITVSLSWTDDVGATTENVITNFDATSTGRVSGIEFLHLNSSDISFSATTASITGTLNYNIIICSTLVAKEPLSYEI
jgi:hypothetical protein